MYSLAYLKDDYKRRKSIVQQGSKLGVLQLSHISSKTEESDGDISNDSEKSYETLFNREEVYETVSYLIFNLVWLFIVALASVISFVVFTYSVIVDPTIYDTAGIILVAIVCNVIIAVDTIAAILHSYWKRYSAYRDLTPRSKFAIVVDGISLIWMIINLSSTLRLTTTVIFITLAFLTFRLYRAAWFFYVVSGKPGLNTVEILLQKYGVVLFLFTHTFACILLAVSKQNNNGKKNWTELANGIYHFNITTPLQWYIIAMYFSLGITCTEGNGDLHATTDVERVILIIQLIIAYFLIAGVFLGAWTSVQVDVYRRHSIFMNRLNLIKKVLNNKNIPVKLRQLFINHYLTFWNELKAVQKSDLFERLPESLKERLYLDHYWNAFEETYLLRSLHPAFLRAIASTMTTEIYAKDELIYIKGEEKNSMIFIQRGTIEILSTEDGKSPILSFGAGTCLGETNLIYNFESPVTIKASTYVILQRLLKKNLWRTAYKYRRLQQIKEIHARMNNKLEGALNVFTSKTDSFRRVSIPTLKIVKALFNDATTMSFKGENLAYGRSMFDTKLKDSDEIFIKTKYPWILQPTSDFLNFWEYVVCFSVLLAAIWYPYRFSFARSFPSQTHIITAVVDCVFTLDVLFQTFTAVETKTGIVTSVTDILSERKTRISFILDILSIFPLHVFTFSVDMDFERLSSALMMNRLLKLYRLIKFLAKYGVTLSTYFTLIRCTKYVLYLLLISYYIGSLFYVLACYDEICLEHSWFTVVKETDLKTGMLRYTNPFQLSLFYGTSLLTLQGSAGVIPTTIVELVFTKIFFVIALIVFCYLVADYSATVMLGERSREDFVELAYEVRKYLTSNNILSNIERRSSNYLTLQWSYNKAYNLIMKKSVLYDAPLHLFNILQMSIWHEYLEVVPLFQGVSLQSLQMIIRNKEIMLLPPNDVIIYTGNIVKHMYIIENGYCEIISSLTGKVEKVLGPLTSFCHFDMLLDRPVFYTVRTVTHVRLLKFSCKNVKNELVKFDKQLNYLIAEVKSSPTIHRLFSKTGIENYETTKEFTPSWYTFSKRKTSVGYQEYENGFKNTKLWTFLKPMLLRRTLTPNGDFIVIWELTQSVRIFLMCITANLTPILTVYFPNATYINIFFDVLTILDMYVRMHLCYYNNKGVVITHPRYTAHNYFTTTFPIDLFTLLPLPSIYNLMVDRNLKPTQYQSYDVQFLLTLHRLLQIYRIPGALYYFKKDLLRPPAVALKVAQVCLITVILLNALAVVIMVITCDVKKNSTGNLIISPKEHSWLIYVKDNFKYNIEDPINLYITQLYFTVSFLLLMQFGDVLPHTTVEVYICILLVITGYLMFTYVLVVVTSCRVNVTGSLAQYQQHMQHLISYMKRENLSRTLQKCLENSTVYVCSNIIFRRKVINYYEYIWERQRGLETSDVLDNYHFALKEDLVLSLYGETFNAIPVFANAGRSFYSALGMQVVEEYYLKNFTIVHINDIIGTFYIIHKGKVAVIAPDGSLFATLTPGCVFGHIDNTPNSRSMVSILSKSKVDLLSVSTKRIYSILKDHPTVGKQLERHILLENLSYIDNNGALLSSRSYRFEKESEDASQKKGICKEVFDMTIMHPFVHMNASFLSCIIVPYHLAFKPFSYLMLSLSYILDFFHVLFLYNKYLALLWNKRDRERLKLDKQDQFFHLKIEIFALLPFDVIALIFPRQSILYYLAWCRLNRMARIVWVFVGTSIYSITVLVEHFQILQRCIIASQHKISHIGACILYLMACPGNVCKENSWVYDADGNLLCDDSYICSFYFIINLITFTTLGDLTPNSVLEVLIFMVLAILGKIITTVLIANISAIIQNYSTNLSAFDYELATLKQYLENNSITRPLINQTVIYVNELWNRDQGLQLPVLLNKAPKCLIQEIKIEAYGQHIYKSFLFGSCHKDLLRLIISKLKVQTYFRGDIICHQGAVNHNMYFIHKGIVYGYENDGLEQKLTQQLGQFDCFGTLQGLLSAIPHSYTYKAQSVCVVLTLHLKDWLEFLHFYQAAKKEIYSRLYNL